VTNVDGNKSTLAIVSSRVVLPQGVEEAAVIIAGEKIVAVVAPNQLPRGCAIHDVGHLAVSPGVIDAHVHVNEPGRTEWEGFATATRAAVAGGITTIVDMPLNSSPVTTTCGALKAKVAAAQGQCHCDVGCYGGLVPGNAAQIGPLMDAGVLGIKAFLCPSGLDDFPPATEDDLRQAMPTIAERNGSLLVHGELPMWQRQTQAGVTFDGGVAPSPADPRSYPQFCASRPDEWELEAIALMIKLSQEYDCRVHIVHLSTAKALGMIAAAKSAGVRLTVETCPHYLAFSAESIPDGDTRFKCAPPIRGRKNREQLWEALKSGVIDTIGSDHSPCLPEMKHLESGDFLAAWGGVASLQWLLSATWTEASQRGHALVDLARWLSSRPAQLLTMDPFKGRIHTGMDADLVVWDPDSTFTVGEDSVLHRHRLTPYLHRTLKGQVHQTYLRGKLVFDRGRFPSEPSGSLINFA
jgi:allantoinase